MLFCECHLLIEHFVYCVILSLFAGKLPFKMSAITELILLLKGSYALAGWSRDLRLSFSAELGVRREERERHLSN